MSVGRRMVESWVAEWGREDVGPLEDLAIGYVGSRWGGHDR